MAKEIQSILCEFCSVRFYHTGDVDEIYCPVCGQHYYKKDGKWIQDEIEG